MYVYMHSFFNNRLRQKNNFETCYLGNDLKLLFCFKY